MDPALAKALADAGGWAVCIALVTAIGIGAWRGAWVPGVVWRSEGKRADVATTTAERNVETMAKLVGAVEQQAHEIEKLRAEIRELGRGRSRA